MDDAQRPEAAAIRCAQTHLPSLCRRTREHRLRRPGWTRERVHHRPRWPDRGFQGQVWRRQEDFGSAAVCRGGPCPRNRVGMTTAYITHPDCLRHEMGAEHPERPQRLVAIDEHLRSANLLETLRCLPAPLAEPDDLKRVHAP